MIRFFCTVTAFLCLWTTSLFAQDSILTEEAVSKYIADTKEVAEALSYDRYEEWVRIYLGPDSELEIKEYTAPEGKNPTESTMTLNNNQYLAMANSELEKKESYKILQTAIKSIKIAENKKSAVLVWGYRFQQSVKRGFRFVPSFGTVECQELIVMNAWTGKAKVSRSLCEIKTVVTAPADLEEYQEE